MKMTVKELAGRTDCLLIDIRGEETRRYGTIPGAIAMDPEEIRKNPGILAEGEVQGKFPVFFCIRGIASDELCEDLNQQGIQAGSLEGGYNGWLMSQMDSEDSGEKTQKEVEESIRKEFKRCLFTKFAKAVVQYELVEPEDRIAVCISGGKDSMLMAKLFQELKRHNKIPFELVFLVMDPGYNKENRKVIEHNAKKLGIPITIFETQIFEAVYEIEKSPCYLCARMRRGYLYSKAKELGCNKIALGHHFDDVIETILMGMLYGGQVQTMMPKLHSTNFEGMELIRTMYLIREDDIKRWRDANGLHFIQCACRFTDTCTTCDPDGRSVSKRMEVKNLIREMKKGNPFVEKNIFRSVENVNLNTVIAYKQNGERIHFLDHYKDRNEDNDGEQMG